MSKQVDERVVEMRFDNQQFESGVKTTMSTIDKLKQSLKFTNASKGLEDLSGAAKKLDFSEASDGTKTLTTKMSTLGVIGFSVISKITSAVIDLGVRAVKAASSFGGLQSAMAGFQEYETQINAVQTILANTSAKGTTLDQVNAALDELNTYADKTIYNFTQMTRNIGTFTAAGVDLETSVAAIQGIANLAAVSGSSSMQASMAMYQLSQALAAGRVSLMDWNSVVNAGMGGEVFQNALKRTARVMGKDVDAAIEKYGSFRESLTQGEWLTTDVLTETLRQFTMAAEEGSEEWENFKASLKEQGYTDEQAEEILKMANTATDAATKVKTFTQLIDTLKEAAQSGWTQTWEIIIGDFEEVKEFFTYLSDFFSEIIGNKANNRNEILELAFGKQATSDWEKLKGKITDAGLSVDDYENKMADLARSQGVDIDKLIEDTGSLEGALKKAFELGDIDSNIISDAFTSMADSADEGASNAEDLNAKLEETQRLVDEIWSGDWGNGEDRIRRLTEAGYDYDELQALVDLGYGYRLTLDDLSDSQLKSIGYTDEQIAKMRELADEYENTDMVIEDKMSGRELLIDSIKNILESLKTVMDAIGEGWKNVFPSSAEQKAEVIYNVLDAIHNVTENIKNFATNNADNITRIFSGIFSVFGIGKDLIVAAWEAIEPIFGSIGDVKVDFLDLVAVAGDWLTNLRESIRQSDIFANVLEPISGFLNGIIDGIIGFGTGLRDKLKFPDLTPFIDGVKNLFGSLKEKINIPTLDKIVEFFRNLVDMDRPLGSAVGTTFNNVIQAIADFLNSIFNPNFDFDSAAASLWEKIKGAFSWFGDAVKNLFTSIFDGVFGEGSFDINFARFEVKRDGIVDRITMIAQPIIDAVMWVIDQFRTFFSGLNIFQPVDDAFADINDEKNALNTHNLHTIDLSGITGEAPSSSSGGTITFLDLIKEFFSKIGEGIGGIVDAVKSVFEAIVKPFNKDSQVIEGFSKFWEGLVTLLSGIASALGTLFSGVGDILKDADFDKLLGMFKTGGSLYAIFMIIKSIRDVTKSFGKAAGIFDEIGEFFKTLNEEKKLEFKESFATKVLKMAVSVVLIASAMKIFASAVEDFGGMNTDTIDQGLLAISLLLLGMVGLIQKVGTKSGMLSAGVGIMAVAVAMKIFAWAAKDLGTINPLVLLQAVIAIGVLTFIISKLTESAKLGKKQKSGMISAGIGIAIIAAAMKIFASAVKDFGEIDPDVLTRGLISMALIMALSKVVIEASAKSHGMISAGIGIALIAASMKIFASAVKDFAELSRSKDEFYKALGAVAIIMLLITAFTRVTAYSRNMFSSGVAMILIAAAIKMLADAAKEMADVEWEDLGKLGSIAGAVLIFAVAMAAIGKLKLSGAMFKGTASVVGLVALIGAVLWLFGQIANMDGVKELINGGADLVVEVGNALKRAVDAFADPNIGIFALIALALGLFSSRGFMVPASGIASITGCVALIGAIFWLFGRIPDMDGVKELINGGADLIAEVGYALQRAVIAFADPSIGIFALICAVLGLFKGSSFVVGAVGIATISAFVAETGAILWLFGQVGSDPNAHSLINGGAELIKTIGNALKTAVDAFADPSIGIFALICAVLGIFKGSSFVTGAVGIATISAFVAEIGVILWLFGQVGSDPNAHSLINGGADLIKTIANALKTAVDAFADPSIGIFALICAVLGLFKGSSFIAGAVGIATISAFVAEIGAILWLFGQVGSDPNVHSLINGGADLIKTIADNLKTAVDAFADPSIGIFALICAVLGLFAGSSFVVGEVGIATISAFVGSIGAILWLFGQVGSDPNAHSLINGGAELIKTIASALSEAVGAFLNMEHGGVFAAMVTIFGATGGLATLIGGVGIASLGAMATEIGAIIGFFGMIAEYTDAEAKLESGTRILEAIATAVGKISGSFISAFGEGFTSRLPAIGENLSSFMTNAQTFLDGLMNIDSGISAKMDTLAEVIGKVVRMSLQNGFASFIYGDDGITSFGEKIKTFSQQIVDATTTMGTVNTDNIDTISQAIDDIQEVLTPFQTDGNIFKLVGNLMDSSSFDSFGENLKSIGDGLASFYGPIQGNGEDINAAIGMLQSLVTVFNTYVSKDISNLTSNIDNISGKMSSFASQIGSIDNANLQTAIDNVEKIKSLITGIGDVDTSGVTDFKTALTNLSDNAISGFVSAFTNSTTQVEITNAVNGMIGYAINAIFEAKPMFESNGAELIGNLASGFLSAESVAKSGLSSVMSSVTSMLRGWYGSFYYAGSYLVTGFAMGINDSLWRAEAKARAMANTAYEAAKNALDINSPSKVFRKLAYFIPEGMAAGIDRMTYLVEDSSAAMADTAIEGTRASLSNLGFMLGSDIDDVQPTIRPVLDLSDVEYGARTINSMFGAANAGTISAMMNANIQNGSTNRLLSAIENLRADLGNVGGSTVYNVNGITYDDGTNIANAVGNLVRAARIERRV